MKTLRFNLPSTFEEEVQMQGILDAHEGIITIPVEYRDPLTKVATKKYVDDNHKVLIGRTISGNTTLNLDDVEKLLLCNNSNNMTLTIPVNIFETNDVISIIQLTDAKINVVVQNSSTQKINSKTSSRGRDTVIQIRCIAEEEFKVYGGE